MSRRRASYIFLFTWGWFCVPRLSYLFSRVDVYEALPSVKLLATVNGHPPPQPYCYCLNKTPCPAASWWQAVYNAWYVLPGVDLLRCLFKTYFNPPCLHVTQLHVYLRALTVNYFGIWRQCITRQTGPFTVNATLLIQLLHNFVSYNYMLRPLTLAVLRPCAYKTCSGISF
jgi:hypothetical protein